MINNWLQLLDVNFGFIGKKVHNKSTNGLLNVDMHAVDCTMNRREATPTFETYHDLNQLSP
jgi:hypothetical protein